MANRRHRKQFPCGHRGLGQCCQACDQARRQTSRQQQQQQQQRLQQRAWRDSFHQDPINLKGFPKHVVKKARQVMGRLAQGTHYSRLGGVRWHHNPSIVRIPLGRDYRLLCRYQGKTITPDRVLSHEDYNNRARGTHR